MHDKKAPKTHLNDCKLIHQHYKTTKTTLPLPLPAPDQYCASALLCKAAHYVTIISTTILNWHLNDLANLTALSASPVLLFSREQLFSSALLCLHISFVEVGASSQAKSMSWRGDLPQEPTGFHPNTRVVLCHCCRKAGSQHQTHTWRRN